MTTAAKASSPGLKPRADKKNERFPNDGSYASVERQLHRLAMKCYARVQALGLSMDFDDVMAEMNLSYVRARMAWNPDKGARFSTYCQTACMNNFNQRIEKQETERVNLGMISYREALGPVGSEEDAEDDPLSILGSDGVGGVIPSIENDRQVAEEARQRIARLTAPTKRLVLALLMDEKSDPMSPSAKLADLAKSVGLSGDELKRVKREIKVVFGVQCNF